MHKKYNPPAYDFEYMLWKFRITKYNYSPAYPGTYYQPPEPAELEITEIYIQEWSLKGDGDWILIPSTMLEFFLEVDANHLKEEFYEHALSALEEEIEMYEVERGDYEYHIRKERGL